MLTPRQHTDFSGTNGRKLRPSVLAVRVRPIRPSDAPALAAGFEELSDMSRYYRFHSGMRRLPERLLRYLTEVDGVNHVALVALDACDDRGVGVARFVRSAQAPASAELAVTVLDRAQGRGVARRLLAELAAVARARGIDTFTANVIAGNTRARRLLTGLGAIGRGHASDVMAFHLPVAALTAPAH
jgi:GNAT superfamily N-acetyltransferase